MKFHFTIILLLIAFSGFSQRDHRAGSKDEEHVDIKGKWKLTNLVGNSLTLLTDKVEDKHIVFTKDSVFITIQGKQLKGVYKLINDNPQITVNGKRFTFDLISSDGTYLFVKTDREKYCEYYVRE